MPLMNIIFQYFNEELNGINVLQIRVYFFVDFFSLYIRVSKLIKTINGVFHAKHLNVH